MNEQTFRFGQDGMLVGTISAPDGGLGRVGMVLLNAGVVHRIGPHRINVRLARRLAKLGVASIRFDLAGQGDSTRSASGRNYHSQAVDDISTAMDALSAATGLSQFAIFGFCSGAHHGYNAARLDKRIVGLMIYDAFIYPTFKSHLIHYRNRIAQHGFAKSVIGRVSRVLKSTRARLFQSDAGTNNAATNTIGFNGIPVKEEFAAGLQALLAQDVNISVVNSGGFEAYNYSQQFHDAFKAHGISEKIKTKFFPDINHTATTLAAQNELVLHIERWMIAVDGKS